jgi:glutamine synthetase
MSLTDTPRDLPAGPDGLHPQRRMSIDDLVRMGARAAALVFVDNAGVARMKCVPLDRLSHAAERGVGISIIFGAIRGDDLFAPVRGLDTPAGEMRLVADLNAAAILSCAPGWAWAPVDQRDQDGRPWPGCQRWFLQRMIDRAADAGLRLLAGYELEWTVGRDEGERFVPIHSGPGYGAATFGALGAYLLALVDTLASAHVGVEQLHPEYSPGQVEVSLSPRDPLRAADESVLTRHIARTLAEQAGWRASFSPVVSQELLGNGGHIHVSVWRDGENQFAGGQGPAGLRPLGEAFLAGVLAELGPLTALAAPSAISYRRLQPSHWAGAYTCWGHENREAALRLESAVGPGAQRSANVEWKSVDTSANPYLVLGGVIAAGVAGVQRGLRLPPPVAVDPATLTEAERQAGGIARLPDTLAAAAEALASSALLRDAMGEFLHECIVTVRRDEADAASALDDTALFARHRWRY